MKNLRVPFKILDSQLTKLTKPLQQGIFNHFPSGWIFFIPKLYLFSDVFLQCAFKSVYWLAEYIMKKMLISSLLVSF